MRRFLNSLKGLVFGRPVSSDHAAPVMLRTRMALPVFGAGLLSAVAYAPDAIIDSLRRGGQQAASMSVGIGVVVILMLLALAYRDNVRSRPDERADYGLVRDVLGAGPGVVTGAALLIDYLFTVAVSVSAITGVITFTVPELRGWARVIGVGVIAVMTLASLRGIRDRTRVLLTVWFGFLVVIGILMLVALVFPATDVVAPDAVHDPTRSVLVAFAGAISSGAVMVTGIEHLASSGPFHAPPRGVRAGRTVLTAAAAASVAFLTVIWLAWRFRVTGWVQGPVLLQVTEKVTDQALAVWIVGLSAAAILYSAAFAVFRRFSNLASLLARDAYLPRQLSMANDRLVFRGGVLLVAGASALVVIAANANLLALVHMYVIGVFSSIVLSQLAMVRHFGEALTREASRSKRRRLQARRTLHGTAVVVASAVLIVVAVFNFVAGAWIALVAIVGLVVLMRSISTHYARMREDVRLTPDDRSDALPSSTHGVVLVAQLHRPAMRALAVAKAARHARLEAVAVAIDRTAAAQLQREWGRRRMGMPLIVLDSPFRDLVGPVLEYVRSLHRESPRDVVVVYVPEYVVGRWWERFLHNKASQRLRDQLLSVPNVVVSAVPWQLESARVRSAQVRASRAAEGQEQS
ncbi:APC family permease [Demequina capsici]|uniref:APC family permease n=1 Tax=Demequina capsici TaxID=3075620 RepID=A0AA96FEG1_9MICO|nr:MULTISPECIES: APC family permease [unclassified Demequina]WNM25713.1 APC family permease [Demequina sp. OYTSA14]WNM28608.1 APC family permease [Demequina sp. PMTSA13]